ncbi:MAG: ShlB/FhaC/HecB family hemolysin secretion/activation protein [Planctomycetota bacterium]|jgi:hemolysin activation/secretion protein
MGLSKLSKAFVPISLVFLIAVTFAENEGDLREEESKKILEKSRSSTENATSFGETILLDDTTQRFLVRKLQIRGNHLISTAELLEELPMAYIVSTREDDEPVKEIYDFRAIHDVVHDPGLKRSVSLKTIQGLTKYILSRYQQEGYAGIYVYVPAEAVQEKTELADAILPVQILEGRIAQIAVGRYDFDRQPQEEGILKSSAIESWSPIREGDVIQKKTLDDFVRLLNLNPDRYVSPVVSRSAEPNALNLSYDLYETSPWHWYVQADNSGTKDRQWSPRAGLINTNLTGIDDRFSAMYQAAWEKGIEEEYAVFGSYDFPVLTPKLRLNLYSGYSQFDIPAAGINFLGNGSFYGSMLSYNVLQMGDWFVDLIGSISNERSKVTPSLGIASNVDMELWGVGANLHRSDDTSNTSITFNRSENMGGSNKRKFEDARIDAGPDFTIYSFAATHSQYLDSTKINRISSSFRSVTSDERLVPAKMTTFGGLYSVRGYEEDEIVTDGGIIISAQYEFDIVKAGSAEQKETEKPLLRKLATLAFIDYGRAKIKDAVASEKRVRELCSTGTGITLEVGDDFSAQIYYGWALRGTDETDRGEGRVNANFIKRF